VNFWEECEDVSQNLMTSNIVLVVFSSFYVIELVLNGMKIMRVFWIMRFQCLCFLEQLQVQGLSKDTITLAFTTVQANVYSLCIGGNA